MRFREYLNEMTLRTGSLRRVVEPIRIEYEPQIIKAGRLLGEFKSSSTTFQVYKSTLDGEVQFGVYDGENLATLFNGKYKKFPEVPRAFYLDQMVTADEYLGQHLSAKLIVFLKNKEKVPVILSDIHSKDTVQNIRKISRVVPELIVRWFNIYSGEYNDFDPDTDDKDTKHLFGSNGLTKWRILIEGNNE